MLVQAIRRIGRATLEAKLDGEAPQAVLAAIGRELPMKSGRVLNVSPIAARWPIAADLVERVVESAEHRSEPVGAAPAGEDRSSRA